MADAEENNDQQFLYFKKCLTFEIKNILEYWSFWKSFKKFLESTRRDFQFIDENVETPAGLPFTWKLTGKSSGRVLTTGIWN